MKKPLSKHFIDTIVKGKKFDFNAFKTKEEFENYQKELEEFKKNNDYCMLLPVKLHIQLIPKICWGNNVRTSVKKSDWDKIRKDVYERESYECRICREDGKSLHAHEVWEWDEENLVQKLEDIIGICEACHNTIHYGRAQMIGKHKNAKEHFIKVNQCDEFDWYDEVDKAKMDFHRRSLIDDWKLDLSYIEEQGYEIKGK
jgi:hypothetical protein